MRLLGELLGAVVRASASCLRRVAFLLSGKCSLQRLAQFPCRLRRKSGMRGHRRSACSAASDGVQRVGRSVGRPRSAGVALPARCVQQHGACRRPSARSWRSASVQPKTCVADLQRALPGGGIGVTACAQAPGRTARWRHSACACALLLSRQLLGQRGV
jgi:hypothetical protein